MRYIGRSGVTYTITGDMCTILAETTEDDQKVLLWKTTLPDGSTLLSQVSALLDEEFEKDEEGVLVDPGQEIFLELTEKEATIVLTELSKTMRSN